MPEVKSLLRILAALSAAAVFCSRADAAVLSLDFDARTASVVRSGITATTLDDRDVPGVRTANGTPLFTTVLDGVYAPVFPAKRGATNTFAAPVPADAIGPLTLPAQSVLAVPGTLVETLKLNAVPEPSPVIAVAFGLFLMIQRKRKGQGDAMRDE